MAATQDMHLATTAIISVFTTHIRRIRECNDIFTLFVILSVEGGTVLSDRPMKQPKFW